MNEILTYDEVVKMHRLVEELDLQALELEFGEQSGIGRNLSVIIPFQSVLAEDMKNSFCISPDTISFLRGATIVIPITSTKDW
jgi:hypothetical protein